MPQTSRAAALAFALGVALVDASRALTTGGNCPPADFSTVLNFNLDSFISTRWYIQQQMATKYLPASWNRCVYAEYALRKKSWLKWGYDIDVHNYAEEVQPPHKVHDSGTFLCAKVYDAARGKLGVAPCFLPPLASGDYWVIAYDEMEGWALISGGAPTESAPGGCRPVDLHARAGPQPERRRESEANRGG
mmetsp:Transcript_71591/g.219283  ORF Transcript_71591/g.219283 Transcript_71591/m.219283 type:complete len:191 (-) Transcript_71591:113-685(-)